MFSALKRLAGRGSKDQEEPPSEINMDKTSALETPTPPVDDATGSPSTTATSEININMPPRVPPPTPSDFDVPIPVDVDPSSHQPSYISTETSKTFVATEWDGQHMMTTTSTTTTTSSNKSVEDNNEEKPALFSLELEHQLTSAAGQQHRKSLPIASSNEQEELEMERKRVQQEQRSQLPRTESELTAAIAAAEMPYVRLGSNPQLFVAQKWSGEHELPVEQQQQHFQPEMDADQASPESVTHHQPHLQQEKLVASSATSETAPIIQGMVGNTPIISGISKAPPHHQFLESGSSSAAAEPLEISQQEIGKAASQQSESAATKQYEADSWREAHSASQHHFKEERSTWSTTTPTAGGQITEHFTATSFYQGISGDENEKENPVLQPISSQQQPHQKQISRNQPISDNIQPPVSQQQPVSGGFEQQHPQQHYPISGGAGVEAAPFFEQPKTQSQQKQQPPPPAATQTAAGPPVPAADESLAEQFKNIKGNLIESYERDFQRTYRQEVQQHALVEREYVPVIMGMFDGEMVCGGLVPSTSVTDLPLEEFSADIPPGLKAKESSFTRMSKQHEIKGIADAEEALSRLQQELGIQDIHPLSRTLQQEMPEGSSGVKYSYHAERSKHTHTSHETYQLGPGTADPSQLQADMQQHMQDLIGTLGQMERKTMLAPEAFAAGGMITADDQSGVEEQRSVSPAKTEVTEERTVDEHGNVVITRRTRRIVTTTRTLTSNQPKYRITQTPSPTPETQTTFVRLKVDNDMYQGHVDPDNHIQLQQMPTAHPDTGMALGNQSKQAPK